jgi:hypothetical protein
MKPVCDEFSSIQDQIGRKNNKRDFNGPSSPLEKADIRTLRIKRENIGVPDDHGCYNRKRVLLATMSFFPFVLNDIETSVEYLLLVGIEHYPLDQCPNQHPIAS